MIERYPAAAGSVIRARDAVARLAASAGLRHERLESIRLAVSEAVTNAIEHAYRGGDGVIEFAATIASGELQVVVADRGCGFQTPAKKPGLRWGLPLMTYCSDDFLIAERRGGGTDVRMRFKMNASSDRGLPARV